MRYTIRDISEISLLGLFLAGTVFGIVFGIQFVLTNIGGFNVFSPWVDVVQFVGMAIYLIGMLHVWGGTLFNTIGGPDETSYVNQ